MQFFDEKRIEVGASDEEQLLAASHSLTTTVRVLDGTASIVDFGPLVIGFTGMEFGPLTLDAAVLLGGYQGGAFQPQFGAAVDATWLDETEDTQQEFGASFQAIGELVQDVDTGETRLDVQLGTAITYLPDPAPVMEFENLGLDLNLLLKMDSQLRPSPAEISLESASVDSLAIHVGPLLTLEAANAKFNFVAPADAPFLVFQGDSAEESGELAMMFGDPSLGDSNPLAGLRGSMGNFGIGVDEDKLRFYRLEDFFAAVEVPDDFRFGLPEWLPFEVRKVGVRFLEEAVIEDVTEVLELSEVALIFSGGLAGNDLWPITGQVENMEVDLPALAACGQLLVDQGMQGLSGMLDAGLDLFRSCEFPISNLDLAEFAIEPFEIGSVTIGGGRGLGLLSIDSDDDGVEEKVMYGRILGQFAYADVGAGVELIVTESGPVLGRVFAGVPIPIGLLVGAFIGSAVFPGVGSGTGAAIGEKTGFILTGLEGGLVFRGDPLPRVEDPIDILHQPALHFPLQLTLEDTIESVEAAQRDGGYTWSNGFTFAGAATLTNIYVNGLISGTLTLGANIGYGDEVGFQLFGIGDLNVAGMPLTSAGILFDFSDPLDPALNMAVGLPGTLTNPLALLLPARGEFGVRVDTNGVSHAAALSMRTLLEEVQSGVAAVGDQLLDKTLDALAIQMEAERAAYAALNESERERAESPSRLLQITLDQNRDKHLDKEEFETHFDRSEIIDRLLGTLDLTDSDLATAANAADAILSELVRVGVDVVRQVEEGVKDVQQDGFLKQLAIPREVVFEDGLPGQWPILANRQALIVNTYSWDNGRMNLLPPLPAGLEMRFAVPSRVVTKPSIQRYK